MMWRKNSGAILPPARPNKPPMTIPANAQPVTTKKICFHVIRCEISNEIPQYTRLNPAMNIAIDKTTIELVEGDIAEQDTDAVVTAAHWKLHGGDGTDGAIHSKGGPKIMEECRRIGGCPIGSAVITGAGQLKARHVIHAVGPVYLGGNQDAELLRSAYTSSLELAVKNELHSISFPSISTGAFGYPIQEAAPVAMQAIVDFLKSQPNNLDLVRMVLFPYDNKRAREIYSEALEKIIAEQE
jgi:O-acetyl-ADP-ribose deacetylase (regulator of RNase III)